MITFSFFYQYFLRVLLFEISFFFLVESQKGIKLNRSVTTTGSVGFGDYQDYYVLTRRGRVEIQVKMIHGDICFLFNGGIPDKYTQKYCPQQEQGYLWMELQTPLNISKSSHTVLNQNTQYFDTLSILPFGVMGMNDTNNTYYITFDPSVGSLISSSSKIIIDIVLLFIMNIIIIISF